MNGYNTARSMVMHIDLNSCFTTVEQQARLLLRGRPVIVLNRKTEHTSAVAVSYEAKARGVTVGMSYKEAKLLCPDIIALESDPEKYRHVYRKLMTILSDYSPNFAMKSIDEGVIDFNHTSEVIASRDLVEVAHEIKRRLRSEIGDAMRCNIGIAPNRFLAKTAAGLNKPDGLNVITYKNLRKVLSGLVLTDLTGIAVHNERRLNSVGIYTPIEFLDASMAVLKHQVFKSICGEQWYMRLRGWEMDDVHHDVKTIGRQYVLESRDLTREMVCQRLHNLCESVGIKLRSQQRTARGIGVFVHMVKGGKWKGHRLLPTPFFSNEAIFTIAKSIFNDAPAGAVKLVGVYAYHLHDGLDSQLSLFGDELARDSLRVGAIDDINQRYGERTIHSANTLPTNNCVKQKIPFGSTRYL